MAGTPSWSFLARFRAPPRSARLVTWAPVSRIVETARAQFQTEIAGLPGDLDRSDTAFARLGGDPCRHDWTEFRPLGLRREEAWSDWLAYLLKESSTGLLATAIFSVDSASGARPEIVRREWVLPRGYRADLGIRLRGGQWLHLEVKVGDEGFVKTFDTGEAMRDELGCGKSGVRDFILLPDDATEAWEQSTQQCRDRFGFTVTVATWRAVAVGLRRAILAREESPTWEAWAYGFCGVVEQRLLGHPFTSGAVRCDVPLSRLTSLASLRRIVREGESHD